MREYPPQEMNVTATNIKMPRSIHDVACSLNILNIKPLLSITRAYHQAGVMGMEDDD
jgi:hypothetical protein